jgi:hypothetical protein
LFFVFCAVILSPDVHSSVFGERLLESLRRYGFGALDKPQLQALIFYAFQEASPEFRSADPYRRAELLHIPDATYRTLIRRSAMWLSTPDSRDG